MYSLIAFGNMIIKCKPKIRTELFLWYSGMDFSACVEKEPAVVQVLLHLNCKLFLF